MALNIALAQNEKFYRSGGEPTLTKLADLSAERGVVFADNPKTAAEDGALSKRNFETLRRWRNPKSKQMPSPQQIERLAELLEVDPAYFKRYVDAVAIFEAAPDQAAELFSGWDGPRTRGPRQRRRKREDRSARPLWPEPLL